MLLIPTDKKCLQLIINLTVFRPCLRQIKLFLTLVKVLRKLITTFYTQSIDKNKEEKNTVIVNTVKYRLF